MAQNPGDVLNAVKAHKEAGTDNVAFDRAYDFLVGRKKAYSPQLEELVILFIDLAVEFRDAKRIKDVLQQFRQSCTTNCDSLVNVAKHLINSLVTACNRVAEASRGKAVEGGEEGAVDPMDESVEASILRSVSGDMTRDRTERTLLQPWLRFAWDGFSVVIRTLRNLPALERQLQEAVMQPALEFCRKFRRPGDFRRLSSAIEESQRKMLDDTPGNTKPPSYNINEVGEALLHTRFIQLDVATGMDLWMDVERVVDSLQELIRRRRPAGAAGKAASQTARRQFYEKLAEVFWRAQNKLFHAISLLSYTVALVTAVPDAESRRTACTAAVLAVLCVPFWTPSCAAAQGLGALDSSMQRERELAQRLARLLMRPSVQSRATLMHDLMARGYLEKAEPEVIEIYRAIESVGVEASPLSAARDVRQAAIKLFERCPQLKQYEAALYDVASVRVLQHVSGIFKTVSIEYLLSLLPQFSHMHQLEELLCEIGGNNVINFHCCIQQDSMTVEFKQKEVGLDALAFALPMCAFRMLEAQALLPPVGESSAEVATLGLTPAAIAYYSAADEERARIAFKTRDTRIKAQIDQRKAKLQERAEELQKEREEEDARRREEEEVRHRREVQERKKKQDEEAKAAQMAQQNEMLVTEASTQLGLSDRLKGLEKKVKAGQVKDASEVATKIQDALVKQQAENDRKRQEERTRADHYVRECRREEEPYIRAWIEAKTTVSADEVEKKLQADKERWQKDLENRAALAPLQDIVADFVRRRASAR